MYSVTDHDGAFDADRWPAGPAVVLDGMDQLVWLMHGDGSACWFNRRWSEFCGDPSTRLGGAGWLELLDPEHRERCRSRWHAALHHGDRWVDEAPMRSLDGTQHWLRLCCAPLREAGCLRWVGTAVEIGDQKRAEHALHEFGDRTGKLIALLAHELRNPLSPIQLAGQMLQVPSIDDDKRVQAAELIVRQARHMNRLIDNLLSLERFRRGTIELRTTRCDLSELLLDTLEAYRGNVADRQLTLASEVEPGVHVLADETRVVQVIGNLLHNACKYTPAGGSIRVSLQRSGSVAGFARISIVDSGVGIEPALLPGIFGEFVQYHPDLSTARGGLGLGLAMVKRLVDLHGGTVHVDSDGPGRGTRCDVELPLCQSANDAPAA